MSPLHAHKMSNETDRQTTDSLFNALDLPGIVGVAQGGGRGRYIDL